MQNKNARRGLTQQTSSTEQKALFPVPLVGKVREAGKGVVKKETLLDNPPSALRATSPTRGGKETARGFTLIELLVVVLIIGILAAVAMPQYQKAVDRSSATQVLVALKALQTAEEVFFLENGYYTPNMQDLAIEVANIDGWTFTLMMDGKAKVQADSQIDSLRGDLAIVIYFAHSGSAMANKPYCWTDDNNVRAERLCKAMGTPDPKAPNERWFIR